MNSQPRFQGEMFDAIAKKSTRLNSKAPVEVEVQIQVKGQSRSRVLPNSAAVDETDETRDHHLDMYASTVLENERESDFLHERSKAPKQFKLRHNSTMRNANATHEDRTHNRAATVTHFHQ